MNYHDITIDDMKNGDGLRAVLWLSGCEHHCPECQNPITWDESNGLVFDDDAYSELEEYLSREYVSGLTLSGGDPLFTENRAEVEALCHRIKTKFPDKTIWLYTGYDFESIKHLNLLKYIDVCIDGKYMKEQRDIKLKWRGSSNQCVIDVKASLESNTIVLHCD